VTLLFVSLCSFAFRAFFLDEGENFSNLTAKKKSGLRLDSG
jgi:hypothetical protein